MPDQEVLEAQTAVPDEILDEAATDSSQAVNNRDSLKTAEAADTSEVLATDWQGAEALEPWAEEEGHQWEHAAWAFEKGLIEGFFGRPWDWGVRRNYAEFLKSHGFDFYIYAPKFDATLRDNWDSYYDAESQTWSGGENRLAHHQMYQNSKEHWVLDWWQTRVDGSTAAESLMDLAAHYHDNGLHFGLGFSPYGIHLNYNEATHARLLEKIDELDAIGADILCVLFDDIKKSDIYDGEALKTIRPDYFSGSIFSSGETPTLAEFQARIFSFIASKSAARHFFICPTWYTDDPDLVLYSGPRPDQYLEDLGRVLEEQLQGVRSYEIFWTGPKVTTEEFTAEHLNGVAEKFRKKPLIWDNYPANDFANADQLNIMAYQGRPYDMQSWVAGHAVNPMNQPLLTQIPLWSLSATYKDPHLYDKADAIDVFELGLDRLFAGEPELLAALKEDQAFFAEDKISSGSGLSAADQGRVQDLIAKYERLPASDYAGEILDWLSLLAQNPSARQLRTYQLYYRK